MTQQLMCNASTIVRFGLTCAAAFAVACGGDAAPTETVTSLVGTHDLQNVSGSPLPFAYEPDSGLDGTGHLVVTTTYEDSGIVILEADGRATVESHSATDVFRAADGTTTHSTLVLRDVGRWTDLGEVVQVSVDSIYQDGVSLGVGDLLLFQHSGASVKRHVSFLHRALDGTRPTVNADLVYVKRE